MDFGTLQIPIQGSIAMKDKLLEVQDLSVGFDYKNFYKKAVNNFNLQLNEGEAIGLVGESGSGKSLSMLALTRLLPSQASIKSGKILFQGNDLRQLSKKSFHSTISGKEIAMIFQEPMTALNPVYSIGRQLEKVYMRHNYVSVAKARAKALESLEKVKLSDARLRLRQFPHELSGGQRQRVMIALALINNPKILIADEPTTALDVTVQKEIIDLINELRHALDMALIFISHDLSVVSHVADKINFMEKANIVETGATKNILNFPKHKYTKALLNSFWQLDNKPLKIKELSHECTPKPHVQVCNVSKFYKFRESPFKKSKTINAVKNVSFDLYSGETLAIVGESGSGKTTLAKIISGLVKPDKGSVFLGKSLIDQIDSRRRALLIQQVFQDPYSSLNPQKTVRQILHWPLKLHTNMLVYERDLKVVEILQKVGLTKEFMNRYPSQLSGGQRQRVAIARAIILKPKLLLCDEPTSALDATIKSYILDLIQDIKEHLNVGVILISHDISVVKYLADRVLVMYNGEIVEAGSVNEVIGSPQNNYTKNLLQAVFGLPNFEIHKN